jgi:hypothetical protein
MTPDDLELFPFDVTKVNWREFWDVYIRGLRRYIANEPETEDNLREAREKYARRKICHNLMRISIAGSLIYFFYIIVNYVINIF